MKKINVAIIGLGQRGLSLIENTLMVDFVNISAICDLRTEKFLDAEKMIADKRNGDIKSLLKTDDFKEVIKSKPDAILVSTGWSVHIMVALASMEAGIPVAIEVGGTHNIDELWTLVETHEKTKTPFMFLENCCYYKDELLVTSLVRNGLLGKVSYCQGSYCHDLRFEVANGINSGHYRLEEYINYDCENYPTHELGPLAKILNINRGNRFTKLVSMSSKGIGLKEFVAKTEFKEKLGGTVFKQGDVVITLVECENGEVIALKLDTTLPRLYERNISVSGTVGFYDSTTASVVLDNKEFDLDHEEYKKAFGSAENYKDYLPEDWQKITKAETEMVHGGMDYVMLKHYYLAVRDKKEMPIDVYDAAAWMSITALSEKSISNGNIPVDCIDFTRGAYKNRKPIDVVDIPIVKKHD